MPPVVPHLDPINVPYIELPFENLLPFEIRLWIDYTSESLIFEPDTDLFLISFETILSNLAFLSAYHSSLIFSTTLSPNGSLSKILTNSFIVISSTFLYSFPWLDIAYISFTT
jgi:hypothetical protein